MTYRHKSSDDYCDLKDQTVCKADCDNCTALSDCLMSDKTLHILRGKDGNLMSNQESYEISIGTE